MKITVKDGKVNATFDIRFEVDEDIIAAGAYRASLVFGDDATRDDVERALMRLTAERGEHAIEVFKNLSPHTRAKAQKLAIRHYPELAEVIDLGE